MTRLTLAALTALMLPAAAQATQPTTGSTFRTLAPDRSDLGDFRWSDRPVLIFAPGQDDPQYQQALAALRLAEAELVDRQIVVLTDATPGQGQLRDALDIDGFTMLLVGKDGGVKLRSDQVIQPEEIFATIDRMPMRQREMQD
ncbi:DUF4174 domain-containing protein [Pseudooceanicola onchidii]|uniref:DUF4174 domain-containing protein n=1 Tax=Pseudooceanicola onchidii TaxID=2562279 RepID=UPI001F0ECA6C|nr:DUF4174 domain-containing protein [Pseudooceanicola onchidii]